MVRRYWRYALYLVLLALLTGGLITMVEARERTIGDLRQRLGRARAVADSLVATQADLADMERQMRAYQELGLAAANEYEHELQVLRYDCGDPCAKCIEIEDDFQCAPCPEQECPACAERCRLPDALCLLLSRQDTEQQWFTLRLAFHRPGGAWVSTPDWRHEGQRFSSSMGLLLGPGDRRFLRNGSGRTLYPDMTLIVGPRGNLAYRVREADALICGELNWAHIREPAAVAEEEGGS